MKSVVEEFQSLKPGELAHRVLEWKKELFNLKMKAAVSPVKDTSQFKKLRRKIAQALTVMRSLSREQA